MPLPDANAAARIEVANFKKDFKKLPDHVEIAGVPTDHYKLDANYDMTVMFGTLSRVPEAGRA